MAFHAPKRRLGKTPEGHFHECLHHVSGGRLTPRLALAPAAERRLPATPRTPDHGRAGGLHGHGGSRDFRFSAPMGRCPDGDLVAQLSRDPAPTLEADQRDVAQFVLDIAGNTCMKMPSYAIRQGQSSPQGGDSLATANPAARTNTLHHPAGRLLPCGGFRAAAGHHTCGHVPLPHRIGQRRPARCTLRGAAGGGLVLLLCLRAGAADAPAWPGPGECRAGARDFGHHLVLRLCLLAGPNSLRRGMHCLDAGLRARRLPEHSRIFRFSMPG